MMMMMHPIFPLLFFFSFFQDAHNTEAPTSAIVETSLPMQSDTHCGPRFSPNDELGECEVTVFLFALA